jgi:hypothetical protein
MNDVTFDVRKANLVARMAFQEAFSDPAVDEWILQALGTCFCGVTLTDNVVRVQG